VFQGFRQAKSANGGLILSSSQFLILPQLPQKMKLASEVVKVDSKIIILLPKIYIPETHCIIIVINEGGFSVLLKVHEQVILLMNDLTYSMIFAGSVYFTHHTPSPVPPHVNFTNKMALRAKAQTFGRCS
jgi:hypothetical protein